MVTDPVMSFDPLRILQQLGADGVEFVLIGGIAGASTDRRPSPMIATSAIAEPRQLWADCEYAPRAWREAPRSSVQPAVDDRCELDLARDPTLRS